MKPTKPQLEAIIIPIILFIIAFVWKLAYIETRDICLDEPFTIFHAQHSVWDIIKLTAQNEPNPPLFMLLLHFWIKFFGIDPISVRFLPLLFNAFTVVFIYQIGRKFFSLFTGIFAAGLFIFSTYHFYFGLETRTYSLLSLATSSSLFYFLSLTKDQNNRRVLIALIISNFVLIYSHFFGWFVVVIQLIISLSYLKDRLLFKRIIIALAITGATFLPMAMVFVKQFLVSSKGTWVQSPSNSEYLNQVFEFLNSKRVFALVFLFVFAGIIYKIYSKNKQPIKKELLIVLSWWLIPYTIMFLVSSKIPMFINRYILFNTIGFYLFISILMGFLFKKIPLYLIGLSILTLMFHDLKINSKEFYYREVKNASAYIDKFKTDSSIVIIYPHWADLGLVYYQNRKVFKDVYHFDSLCKSEQIFPVWNVDFAKEAIKNNPNKRVLFYQDGSPEYAAITEYLDSTYTKINAAFYPQCFQVSVYEPIVKDSLNQN
ncbi:MAG TPA: hypothetical protein DIW31_08700 [Bacteroidales bacterium]|nr:hypothetical protein [Bacteroidales bacterium]